MSDPLSDFLKKPTANQTPMGGTLQCQECNDVVDGGLFDRAEKVLFWCCKNHHRSQIPLDV